MVTKSDTALVKDAVVQDHYASVPTHAAEKLMAGGKKAVIVLEDQIYTLQITRQGKLLLTK